MTSGRRHLFVAFAPALTNAPKRSQVELAADLRRAWLQHMFFTCTQLASGFLMEHRAASCLEFTLADLTQALYAQARELANAGRAVDPALLRLSSARQKARRYLAYGE